MANYKKGAIIDMVLPPGLSPIVRPPSTTAPTQPSGQAWVNYQSTGSAAIKPSEWYIGLKTPAALPTGLAPQYVAPLKTIRIDPSDIANIPRISSPSQSAPEQKGFFAKYGALLAVGGAGLVTLLALKG